MFVFELERGLFRLTAETPAFRPLFQLPPRIGTILRHLPLLLFLLFSEPFFLPLIDELGRMIGGWIRDEREKERLREEQKKQQWEVS